MTISSHLRSAHLALRIGALVLVIIGALFFAVGGANACFDDSQCPRDGSQSGSCSCMPCPSCPGVCQGAGFDSCGPSPSCNPAVEDCGDDGGDSGGGYVTPDYSIAVSPSYISRTQGQSATYTVTVTTNSNLYGTITLSPNGCPTNSSCSVSPTSVYANPNGTYAATLTVTTANNTPAQNYNIVAVGNHSTVGAKYGSATLNVTPLPVVPTCSSTGPASAVAYGTSGTFYVYAYGVNNATQVYFPTWGEANGQEYPADLYWYPGQNMGGGTWRAAIDLSRHKSGSPDYGTFITHVYMNNSYYANQWCGGTSFQRQPIPTPSNMNGSCPAPGTTATMSWTAPTGFTNFAPRLCDLTMNPGCNPYAAGFWRDDNLAATSWTVGGLTPGHSFSAWVHTVGSPNAVSTSFTCQPTPVPVNGVCGTANGKTYPLAATGYGTDTQCASGTSNNTGFPPVGGAASWSCLGSNGGTNASCSASRTASAPAPDVKVSVWASWAGSGRDTAWYYSSVDAAPAAYFAAPYAVSWGPVVNATSCTLDGAAVSKDGGTVNTYNAWGFAGNARTHTLTCTGSGGTGTDTVTVGYPPVPTNLSATCPIPGTLANISWTAPLGYNTFYTRAYDATMTWPPSAWALYNDAALGSSDSFASQEGKAYKWYVHTRDPMNGAWSDGVWGTTDVSCIGTPINAACGTADKTYAYNASSYGSDSFCGAGTLSGSAPAFPAQGGSVLWTCAGVNGGTNATCSAERDTPPPVATCGAAAKTYPSTSSSYGSDSLCGIGTVSGSMPAFPNEGEGSTWTCSAPGGSVSCYAYRDEPAVAQGFTLAADPTLIRGKKTGITGSFSRSKSTQVRVVPYGGFTGQVTLTAYMIVGAAEPVIIPDRVNSPGYTASLFANIPGKAPNGTFEIIVTGTSGNKTATTSVWLDISDGLGGHY